MIAQIGTSIRRLNGASQMTRKAKRQAGERLALTDDAASETNHRGAAAEMEAAQRGQSGR